MCSTPLEIGHLVSGLTVPPAGKPASAGFCARTQEAAESRLAAKTGGGT
jgi:hypothetical protein